MIKINKKAGFWIRLLATIIDLIIFLAVLIATSFLAFNYKTGKFYNLLNYYLWLSIAISSLLIIWLFIPMLWNGKTVGMAICKIKVIAKDPKTSIVKAIFDRQRLFAFIWFFVFIAFAILVSPQTFEQAALINKKTQPLNKVQKLFLLLPTILASIAAFVETFFILSNAKISKIGLNDKFSQTYTVWINKFEEVEEPDLNDNSIVPVYRKLPIIKYEN
ncbi:RDD family protein [Metamycoplasma spumans]|uniref:RDD family protein n=1 Tax=Metamycoplasma spumans TaxID=92406 RepID=UPI0004842E4F